ncbi:MAG: DUF4190 domain-containing protein [Nocardioides sp.]|nr:DUF4190 domain-containing protein [Nocardioides sp.]
MTNPSDEEPKVDLGKPADPPPTQPMYGQTYGQGSLPPTHSAYGEEQPSQPVTPPAPPNPYGQASSYGQPSFGQAPYGQAPAQSQPVYGQTPPVPYGAQAPYGSQGGVQDSGATTAMVLGIIGLAGIVLCGGITTVLSPFALFMGLSAKKRIDASNGALRGRGEAQTAFITGLIGTILLVLGIIVLIVIFIVIVANAGGSGGSDPSFSQTDI